jgi:hypothetical protein
LRKNKITPVEKMKRRKKRKKRRRTTSLRGPTELIGISTWLKHRLSKTEYGRSTSYHRQRLWRS